MIFFWFIFFESNNSLDCEIVPTFMHIFNIIKDKYEDKIMNLFPKSLIKFKKEAPYERQMFVSFTKELVVKTVKTVAQLVINHFVVLLFHSFKNKLKSKLIN